MTIEDLEKAVAKLPPDDLASALSGMMTGDMLGALALECARTRCWTFSRFWQRVFDEDATRVMGQAYDSARRMLHDKGQPFVVQEIISKRIIDLAANGERDPEILARRALQELGLAVE